MYKTQTRHHRRDASCVSTLARIGPVLSEAVAGYKAHVVVERAGGVECVNAAVARDVYQVVVVAQVTGGISPGLDRIALAVEAGLRAEGGVFAELFGAVVGVELELEVVVP